MTAPLAHPPALQAGPGGDVDDARLERALRTLAAVMEKHGPAPMPIFDRLEAEFEQRRRRVDRIKRFLK